MDHNSRRNFQFSLWDSCRSSRECVDKRATLSILSLRFLVEGIDTYMRKFKYFQFSLWDSAEAERRIDIGDCYFQFSLWDSLSPEAWAWLAWSLPLSILSLRFKLEKTIRWRTSRFTLSILSLRFAWRIRGYRLPAWGLSILSLRFSMG